MPSTMSSRVDASSHKQHSRDLIRLLLDVLPDDLIKLDEPLYRYTFSVFKRPKNDYAGRLIQVSGLQGYQVGDVQVSTKHAGFMVNLGHATASDYIQLIRHVKSIVRAEHGVELETEVKILGEDA